MNKIYDMFNRSVDWFTGLNILEMWIVVAILLLIFCIIGIMLADYMCGHKQMKKTRICFHCLRDLETDITSEMPCPHCGCTVKIKKWRY